MPLSPTVKKDDWIGLKKIVQKISSKLDNNSSPTFNNVTLTSLTTDSLIYPVSGLLTSLGVAANGQIPIGSTGTTPVLATITQTANQVLVANAAGSITLSLPQDLDTAADLQLQSLLVDQNTDAIGLEIDSEATTYTNYGLKIVTGAGAIAAMFSYGAEANGCIYMGMAPNSGYQGTMSINRDLASANTDCALLYLFNDNAGDDQPCLEIRQDGSGPAIHIESGSIEIDAGVTISTGVTVPDGGYIGSVSEPQAIQIEADGDIIFHQAIDVPSDIICGGHVIFDVDNGHIGYTDNSPSITFNNADNQAELLGNLLVQQIIADTPTSITIQSAGGSGADAFIIFKPDMVEGTVWSIGGDDSGESFRISESVELGTNDRLIIDAGGVFHLNAITIDDTGTRTTRIGSGVNNGDAGVDNVFLGYRAGYNNSVVGGGANGTRNVFVGQEAGAGNSGSDNTGAENVGIGAESLENISTGIENTCVGDETGKGITTGDGNCAFGNDSIQGDGTNPITGDHNIAIGTDTLYVLQSGSYNTVLGYQAGYKITTLSNIVALGYQSGYNLVANETGNVFIGYQTGYYVNQTAGTEGEDNIYIGENAGKGTAASNVGAFNIGIGKSALVAIQSGNSNIALGNSAGLVLTDGINNFLVGFEAGKAITTGSNNVFFGYQAGYNQTTSSKDLYIGYQAGYNSIGDPTIGDNVFLGYQSFWYDNGQYNVGIGYHAGVYNDTAGGGLKGTQNIYIGYRAAGSSVNTGYYNVAIASQALFKNTSGYQNFAIGQTALRENTTGYINIAIGLATMYSNIDGLRNTAIGSESLFYNQSGDENLCLGYRAGKGTSVDDCSFNSFLGSQSGLIISTGSSNVFIGYKSGINQTTNSNLLIIDNQNRTSAALEETNSLIYGVFNASTASQSLRINADDIIFGDSTHSDADGGGAVVVSFKREDGAGTPSTAATITGSHDGAGANDTDGKLVLATNKDGTGLVDAIEIDSDQLVGIGVDPSARLHLKAGTATASTAPLKFTAGTALGTPEAGAVEYNDGRFYVTNVATQRALDRASDVAIETVVVDAEVVFDNETLMWTGAMPANSLVAGNVFKFHADGVVSNASANAKDEVTIRIKIGGVTKVTLKPNVKQLTDTMWHIDANATQRTIGGSGERAIHVHLVIGDPITTGDEIFLIGVVALNTAANMDVTITAQWASDPDPGTAGNVISLYQGFMEYKN